MRSQRRYQKRRRSTWPVSWLLAPVEAADQPPAEDEEELDAELAELGELVDRRVADGPELRDVEEHHGGDGRGAEEVQVGVAGLERRRRGFAIVERVHAKGVLPGRARDPKSLRRAEEAQRRGIGAVGGEVFDRALEGCRAGLSVGDQRGVDLRDERARQEVHGHVAGRLVVEELAGPADAAGAVEVDLPVELAGGGGGDDQREVRAPAELSALHLGTRPTPGRLGNYDGDRVGRRGGTSWRARASGSAYG